MWFLLCDEVQKSKDLKYFMNSHVTEEEAK
jgi:hypothetical protein